MLLAELLVAEKLRVHALQGFLRVFLWLFDACFSSLGEKNELSVVVFTRSEQLKGLKNAIRNALKETHGTMQRPM